MSYPAIAVFLATTPNNRRLCLFPTSRARRKLNRSEHGTRLQCSEPGTMMRPKGLGRREPSEFPLVCSLCLPDQNTGDSGGVDHFNVRTRTASTFGKRRKATGVMLEVSITLANLDRQKRTRHVGDSAEAPPGFGRSSDAQNSQSAGWNRH